MLLDSDACARLHVKPDLLAKLTSERVRCALTELDVASRQVPPLSPDLSAEQDAALRLDNCTRDQLDCHRELLVHSLDRYPEL